MSELNTEFIFQLTSPIKYSHKGDIKEALFITLTAPSSRNLKECAFLKQCFYRALPKNTTEETQQQQKADKSEDKDEDIDGEGILALMFMSSEVDLDKVLLTGSKLFISKDIGLLDGETQLKQTHIESISYDDLEGMVGKYLENFILASSLKKLKDN